LNRPQFKQTRKGVRSPGKERADRQKSRAFASFQSKKPHKTSGSQLRGKAEQQKKEKKNRVEKSPTQGGEKTPKGNSDQTTRAAGLDLKKWAGLVTQTQEGGKKNQE